MSKPAITLSGLSDVNGPRGRSSRICIFQCRAVQSKDMPALRADRVLYPGQRRHMLLSSLVHPSRGRDRHDMLRTTNPMTNGNRFKLGLFSINAEGGTAFTKVPN